MYMKKLTVIVIIAVRDYLLKITANPEIMVRGKLITANQSQRAAPIIVGIWFPHVLSATGTKAQEEAQATKESLNPRRLAAS